MTEINDELSFEYAMARRQRPAADYEEIAERITDRLSDEQRLLLAADALVWADELADRRQLALRAVRNFVLAIESAPDVDA